MSPAKKKTEPVADTPLVVTLPQLLIERITVHLEGDSPLVSHAWSEKAKQMMRDTQQKRAKNAREPKVPFDDYAGSLYWLSERPERPTPADVVAGRFGLPSIGFKRAAVDACSHISGVTKVEARGAFHVVGEFVEIHGEPRMREDMVRVGMGSADMRYRAEFFPWSADLTLRYNRNVLSADQIVNLLNTAGFAIGIGENRPQRNGSWGLFHVEGAGK